MRRTTKLKPYKIDKSSWGPGPWRKEPDRVDFVHAGYACLALRHPLFGHWCGYVGIGKTHPYYRRGPWGLGLDAHHGLNYGSFCSEPICHIPKPGMPKRVWWLGFDCGHAFDYSPRQAAEMRRLLPDMRRLRVFRKYRTVAYVKKACKDLAEQLRKIEKGDA